MQAPVAHSTIAPRRATTSAARPAPIDFRPASPEAPAVVEIESASVLLMLSKGSESPSAGEGRRVTPEGSPTNSRASSPRSLSARREARRASKRKAGAEPAPPSEAPRASKRRAAARPAAASGHDNPPLVAACLKFTTELKRAYPPDSSIFYLFKVVVTSERKTDADRRLVTRKLCDILRNEPPLLKLFLPLLPPGSLDPHYLAGLPQ